MDIYCPKCGEPWDNDTLHDVAEETDSTYAKVSAEFRKIGCEAIGSKHGEMLIDNGTSEALSALYDICGDDMDGAASLMDDFRFAGMLDLP